MTENEGASLVASKEGKKSQVKIGDIREIIKIIQVLIAEEIVDETSDFPFLGMLTKKADQALLKKRTKKRK